MPVVHRVTARNEDLDPLAPQREAALFYGLFLRGHSANTLRRDIDVPKKLQDKLLRRHQNETRVQEKLQRANCSLGEFPWRSVASQEGKTGFSRL